MMEIVPVMYIRRHMYQKVNILGVVMQFSFPRMSGGSDLVMTLKIVDESQQEPELSVSMFARSFEDFPIIKAQRDIILLKNVVVTKRDGLPAVNFDANMKSTFLLFSGNDIGNFVAYQPHFAPGVRGNVKRAIDNLRNWHQGVQLKSGMSQYLISLKDLMEAQYFDVICKVLHVRQSNGTGVIYVWDGTDVPALCINEKFDDEQQLSLPLQTDPFPLPSSVIQTFPQTGSILGLVIDEEHGYFHNRFPAVNTWVRMRNITCQADWGMWYGLLESTSKIRLLPDTDQTVLERERSFKQRVLERGCLPTLYNPLYSQLTEFSFPSYTSYDDSPFSTLRDVIAFTEGGVMFKCVVRVLALFSCQEETNIDLRRNAGANIYRLTLEDPTGRLHAFSSLMDEVRFFSDELDTFQWENSVKRLLGVPEYESLDQCSSRSPPWIKVCITSTGDPDGSRSPDPYGYPVETRTHHIIYTKMV